ncbi:MAG: hypothetical protein ACM3XM_00385, partial [Mycobacterium leprae]
QCARLPQDSRNEQLIRNLLMLDAEFEKEFAGAYALELPDGQTQSDRSCRIMLYRSSLVVVPSATDFFNVAYADIQSLAFDPERYCLELRLDLGERLVFTMLGGRFGELEREIRRLTQALYHRTAAYLRERLPAEAPDAQLPPLASTLRQGKAVSRGAIQAAAPGLWPFLEQLLFTNEAGESAPGRRACFEHLCQMAQDQYIYVGLREGFESREERVAPVCWFVVAFPDQGRMAVEVTNESGYATYVYRMAGPVETAVRSLSRAMVALNFRREVISASEAELAGPKMGRYRVALRKLAPVRQLREMFVGKAAHTTEEAWAARMAELLG